MIKLRHVYSCRYCHKPYVLLNGKYKYSLLPVDVITGDEKHDYEFDKVKHRSHLLSCPELQKDWENVKIKWRRQCFEEVKKDLD